MQEPTYRYLKGYTIDPGFSTQLDTLKVNESVYKIKWEEVKEGPFGRYIEVVDYDPASCCYYQPVDLNDPFILSQNGLPCSEGNPQFHQQFVYAVIMKTIEHFEYAIGRKIVWKYRYLPEIADEDERFEKEYVDQLRIYPHAFRDANAYYEPTKQALLFGYFTAGSKIQGSNFPGGVVFTCLSPDIVAHETTHAILDSIHPRFIENTNIDVPAFHEAFADIVALLQRFTFHELLEHQLSKTKGRLDEFNLLGELATQLGQALENGRGALRSAIGKINEHNEWVKKEPDPDDYQTIKEPHFRGAILVSAVFDAFLRLFHFKTQDLLRIATNGTGILPEGNINSELVKRLSHEAAQIASHLLHICIRALDYCPPFDISFGNYLRALITADLDIAPEDENGYRIALIEAFRSRGIFPDRVNTLSVESLQWNKPNLSAKESRAFMVISKEFKSQIKELSESKDRKERYLKTRHIQQKLHNYFTNTKLSAFEEEEDWEILLNKLGLTSKPFYLIIDKKKTKFMPPPIEVHKVSPAFRLGREGRQIDQVIISLSQTIKFETSKNNFIKFRGGSTIILSMSDLNQVEYIISKNIYSQRRFDMQKNYMTGDSAISLNLQESTYDDDDEIEDINFMHLHFNHI